MKTCTACGETKPVSEFTWDVSNERYSSHCRPCRVIEQVTRQRTPQGREVLRRARLKHRYGITPEDYDRMLSEQGGRCAICPATEPGGRGRFFSVDHDHVTGRVRGLLCLRCNNALGWFEGFSDKISAYLSV